MTRINVVPVSELCDQHLLAEFRELTRIPNGVLTGKLKAHYVDSPSEYTLGPGHVKFFTDKLTWLYWRYCQLHLECRKRGFKVTWIWPAGLGLDRLDTVLGYYPTARDYALNRERIRERWPKNARYWGLPFPRV